MKKLLFCFFVVSILGACGAEVASRLIIFKAPLQPLGVVAGPYQATPFTSVEVGIRNADDARIDYIDIEINSPHLSPTFVWFGLRDENGVQYSVLSAEQISISRFRLHGPFWIFEGRILTLYAAVKTACGPYSPGHDITISIVDVKADLPVADDFPVEGTAQAVCG